MFERSEKSFKKWIEISSGKKTEFFNIVFFSIGKNLISHFKKSFHAEFHLMQALTKRNKDSWLLSK